MRGIGQLPRKERDLVLAWKAHLENQHDHAISIYRGVAANHPDDKLVPYLAGDIEFHRGHLSDAVPWFERVLELDPEHEYALDHLVLALGLTEDRDALGRLAARLEAARPSPATLHGLANAKGWLGDVSSALEVALPVRGAPPQRGRAERSDSREDAGGGARRGGGSAPRGDSGAGRRRSALLARRDPRAAGTKPGGGAPSRRRLARCP